MPRGARAVVLATALLSRLLVVAWAGSSIGPTADGTYYEKVARRIAEGHGYTWQWPDGVVTYAAHYPIGYPALDRGRSIACSGSRPLRGHVRERRDRNARRARGARSPPARRQLTRPWMAPDRGDRLRACTRRSSRTPPAIDDGGSDGISAAPGGFVRRSSLRAEGGRLDRSRARPRSSRWGCSMLVRPQSLALAPLLRCALAAKEPWLQSGTKWLRDATISSAVVVTATALGAVCAVDGLRNCVRMEQCALVSVNGGWNLAIGTQTTDGGVGSDRSSPTHAARSSKKRRRTSASASEAREDDRGRARPPGSRACRRSSARRSTTSGRRLGIFIRRIAEHFPYRAKIGLAGLETLVSRDCSSRRRSIAIIKLPGARRRARLIVCGIGLGRAACSCQARWAISPVRSWGSRSSGAPLCARCRRIVPATADRDRAHGRRPRGVLRRGPLRARRGAVRHDARVHSHARSALPAPCRDSTAARLNLFWERRTCAGSSEGPSCRRRRRSGARRSERHPPIRREESPSSTEHDAG